MTTVTVLDALKTHFGFNSFKDNQEEIVSHIMAGRDSLSILPTGSGKSLCYQLPALMMPGSTVVISPLISLMQDQVESLLQLGIKATFINSSLDNYEQQLIMQHLDSYKLIYIAPERLSNDLFITALSKITLASFVIDEAHCISQWGHSFRAEYRNLSQLKSQFPDVPISAFTASATLDVDKDIQAQLNLQSPVLTKASFDRPNLFLSIIEKSSYRQQLTQFLNDQGENSGIIYANTRNRVDQIATFLKSEGYSVEAYHAGKSDQHRAKVQREFILGNINIMVATVAFGMGIHKPDVRFVFHVDMPQTIEHYYQEIGRAGRDGLDSKCVLLFSLQDLVLQKKRLDEFIDSEIQHQMRRKIEAMYALASSATCRRKELLHYFGEKYSKESCGTCDNCTQEVEKIDGSIIAQKILSCVYRLQGNFGVGYVVDVLSGSTRKEILNRGHDQLSTYGLLSEEPKLDIKHYVFSLINQGYCYISDGNYPLLKLSDSAKEVLFEKKEVFFKRPPQRKSKTKTREIDVPKEANHPLFVLLSNKRREIARENDIPPYMVFADRSLMDMSAILPGNKGAFLTVNGVGQRKWDQYGDIFLPMIQSFAEENKLPLTLLSEPVKPVRVAKERESQEKSSVNTLKETLNFINQNLSVTQIANLRGLKERTVVNHIISLIELGSPIPYEKFLSQERLNTIHEAIRKVGAEKLTPIREELGDAYSFEEIGIARAYYTAVVK